MYLYARDKFAASHRIPNPAMVQRKGKSGSPWTDETDISVSRLYRCSWTCNIERGLFCDGVSSYNIQRRMMINDESENVLEGSGRGPIGVLSRHFPKWTEKPQ